MSGLQTKGGHRAGQNSAENALNRTPQLKIHTYSIEYYLVMYCLIILINIQIFLNL